jgi:hypothetical protein
MGMRQSRAFVTISGYAVLAMLFVLIVTAVARQADRPSTLRSFAIDTAASTSVSNRSKPGDRGA